MGARFPPAMTLLTVRHTTTYRYKQPVSFGEHRMMFRPRDSYDQKLLEAWLTIKPEPTSLRWVHDVFGNCVAIADFARLASQTSFASRATSGLITRPRKRPTSRSRTTPSAIPSPMRRRKWPTWRLPLTPQYPDPDQAIHRWVRKFLRKGGPTDTGMLLMTLTYAFKESFKYERRTEPGTR